MFFEIDSWINRSFAREHKKKRKKFISLTKFKYFLFSFIFQTFLIQSYFNFSCYLSSWNFLKFTSCFVKMIVFNCFFLSRIMFMNRRWSSKHAKKWSKSRDIWFRESLISSFFIRCELFVNARSNIFSRKRWKWRNVSCCIDWIVRDKKSSDHCYLTLRIDLKFFWIFTKKNRSTMKYLRNTKSTILNRFLDQKTNL